MNALFALIYSVLDLYKIAIIIYVILSWLVAFQVVNQYNQFVRIVGDFLGRLIEPATNGIKRILPPMGGLDLSPLVLLLLIYFIQRLMIDNIGPQVAYL